jgi:RND superfamily putative drug exporter
MTVRVARWSAEHPWRAIALWLLFVVACVAAGSAAGLRQVNALDTGVGDSGRAARLLHDAGLDSPASEDVLITSPVSSLDAAQARAAAADVTARMRGLAGVASVGAPVQSKEGSALMLEVTIAGDPNTATDRVTPLLDATAATQARYPALRVEEVGTASLNKGVNDQVGADLSAAADISLPVTLVILLLAFGAILAAGVPVLLAISAVGAATGLAAVASHVLPDSGTTSSMILLMGMAVGVDYSLFYVKRAREERAHGGTNLDAIELAAETSGHSIIVSGFAVIVAMLGLFMARDAVFSSLAAGSIIVVAVAVLGSITVLPAVLVKLGRRLQHRPIRERASWIAALADRLRLPARPSPGLSAGREGESRFWSALLTPSLRFPFRTLAVSVLVLLAVAAPALTMRLHSDSPQSLPHTIAEVQTYGRLAAAFPGQQATQQVVVVAPAAASETVVAQLEALRNRLSTDSQFAVDGQRVRASADGRVHELVVAFPFDAESASARAALRTLRSDLVPQTVGTVAGAKTYVGGDTASAVDGDRHLSSATPWVVGFVVLLTMLMMAVVFRSVVLAGVTALINLLSAGAAFGVLTLVFQHTWAEGLLGFRSTGTVINWIPLLTFAVLFGLSMDYHVFVVSRIREAAARRLDTRAAVRHGILRSAGTVTSAAIVMVSVFSIFASLHMVEMKELGVSLAVAVLIDAVVVRAIVLPSLLVLLGHWTWWPATPSGSTSRPPGPERPSPKGAALRRRNPIALLFSGAPWASAAYLFTYLVVGGVWFAIGLAAMLAAGVLSLFWIGLPLLVGAFALLRAVATAERGRARLVGVRLETRYRRSARPGVLAAVRTRLTDGARWRDVLTVVVLWPVLFALDLAALLLWLIPMFLVSLSFWYRYIRNTFDDGTSAHGVMLGYYPDGPRGSIRIGWYIDSSTSALIAAGVGLALLVLVGNHVVVAAARAHVRLIAAASRLTDSYQRLEAGRPDRFAVERELAELIPDGAADRRRT